MTNKEQLTKLKELKEKVKRDIIESKTLAETLMFTILYRAIEEECKELELKIEEENKPTLEEIKFKTMAEEIIKLDLGNLNCVGIRCKDCIYNIEHNSCMCLRGYIKIAIEISEEYLNKLEKENK